MSGERDGASEGLAGFIVDALHGAGVVGAPDVSRAMSIAAEEITVAKSTSDYWCSWCSLKMEFPPGVRASDDAIRFTADGVELLLKRARRVDPNGRIALEIQARAGSFSGCYTCETRIDDLLRFASMLRAVTDAGGGDHTATLRDETHGTVVELTLPRRSTTARYRFRNRKANGLAAELSGSFVVDPAILDLVAHELRTLVHDVWAKA